MNQIVLKPLNHRHQECIAIYYENSYSINRIVRKLPRVRWSQTNKCWYVPLSTEAYQHLVKALAGKAELNISAFKDYLEKRKKITASFVVATDKPNTRLAFCATWKLSNENLSELEKFVSQLKLKAYSTSTISTYRNEFLQLLRLLNKKRVDELTVNDVKHTWYLPWKNRG